VDDQCRGADLFARLGGEEFAVLLADTDNAAARAWADLVHSVVANTWFDDGNALKLMDSIGLAEVDKVQLTPDSITKTADSALYDAKRPGRNRVAAVLRALRDSE